MVASLLLLAACHPPEKPDTGGSGDSADSATDSEETADTGTETGDDTAPDSDTDTGGDSDTGPPPPPDADGDGYGDAALGGDDCDDADEAIHPGAEEWCDVVDHDCDGEALEGGVCGKVQDPAEIGAIILSYPYPAIYVNDYRILSDMNGDGFGEIFVACWDYCGHGQRGYALLPGGPSDTPLSVPEDNLETWVLYSGEYGGEHAEPAGDMNGDGFEDIVLGVTDGVRGLFVFYGPFALDGSLHDTGDADVWFHDQMDGDAYWGSPYVGGVDFDGDGRDDLAATAATGASEDVAADIFFGGMQTGEYLRLMGETMRPEDLGDLDGDGLGDLRVTLSNTDWGWVSGASLRALDGAQVDDIAEGVFNQAYQETDVPYLNQSWKSVGDWDGDGHPELAVRSQWESYSPTPAAEIYFFGGDLYGFHTTDDAVAVLGIGEECDSQNNCGIMLDAGDFDGDGLRDLLTNGSREADGGNVLYVYPGGLGLPAPGTVLGEDQLRWTSAQTKLSIGDLDGDGVDDILGDFVALGEVSAILGWAVPWDDPTYW